MRHVIQGGRSALTALLLGGLLPGCLVSPPSHRSTAADAVVQIHGAGGEELGVSTDWGVVYLGTSQRGGTLSYTAWFGDGPSEETGLVEPLGGGLFLATAELALHSTPVRFEAPRAGSRVRVIARRGRAVREFEARVVDVEGAQGLFLAPNGELLRLGPDAVGAGVFAGKGEKHALVGLLAGSLELSPAGGSTRRVFTVVGPTELWRLAARAREHERPREPRGREDL